MAKTALDHKKDKALLTSLCKALCISKKHLYRDELNWNICGKGMWIDTDSEFWYFHLYGKSIRDYNNYKKNLRFMEVWIDGDDEGVLE